MSLNTSAAPLALLLAACAATPVFAQTASGSSSATPSSWVSDVVVTARREAYAAPNAASATRTDTPLIRVPQSVQVVTRSLIQEQDARTLTDVLRNVSGVMPTRQEEALITGPLVRGFAAEIYLDGLPTYAGPAAAGEPTSLVGVQQIDVVKGPTSTLYGGGVGTPLGGLINVQSVHPQPQASGMVAIRGGSFSTFNPYLDVNTPLTSTVAARLVAEYQSNESWIDQLETERWSVQPSISVQLAPQTELVLQGQVNRRSQLEYSGLPAEQAMAGQIDRNAFPGAPVGQSRSEINNQSATATLSHIFSDALRLTVSGRYYESDLPQYGTFVYPAMYAPEATTPTIYPLLPMTMLTNSQEGTFDANLAGRFDALGGHHEVLVGVNYDQTDFFSAMGFPGVPVGEIDLASPTYDLSFGGRTPMDMTQTDRYETIAAYVQDQATYGRLHLTGSLRYTRLRFREQEQATNETYHRLSPRIGATFDVGSGIALYAGYATGFRGAFGFLGLQPPEPEKSRNVEGGLKLALTRIGVSGTVAVFQQTRENVATADPDNPFLSIQTGEQRARGFEADLVWEPSPAFSLLANYAYTDAEVTADNTIPVGDQLPRVLKNSGRIAGRYRMLSGPMKGLSFGAGVSAFSARQITLPNTVTVPGYAVVDAQAAYDFGRVSVEVSAVNLTDDDAFDPYQYFGFPVVMPTQPRSAYLTLRARF